MTFTAVAEGDDLCDIPQFEMLDIDLDNDEIIDFNKDFYETGVELVYSGGRINTIGDVGHNAANNNIMNSVTWVDDYFAEDGWLTPTFNMDFYLFTLPTSRSAFVQFRSDNDNYVAVLGLFTPSTGTVSLTSVYVQPFQRGWIDLSSGNYCWVVLNLGSTYNGFYTLFGNNKNRGGASQLLSAVHMGFQTTFLYPSGDVRINDVLFSNRPTTVTHNSAQKTITAQFNASTTAILSLPHTMSGTHNSTSASFTVTGVPSTASITKIEITPGDIMRLSACPCIHWCICGWTPSFSPNNFYSNITPASGFFSGVSRSISAHTVKFEPNQTWTLTGFQPFPMMSVNGVYAFSFNGWGAPTGTNLYPNLKIVVHYQ
jgi:hypothetical protein